MQTISSTAQGASITPLNERWIDDSRKRVNVESYIPLGRAAEAGEWMTYSEDSIAIPSGLQREF